MRLNHFFSLLFLAFPGCGTEYDGDCGLGTARFAAFDHCLCDEAADCWAPPEGRAERAVADLELGSCRENVEYYLIYDCWEFNQLYSRAPGGNDPYDWVNIETGETGKLQCSGPEIPAEWELTASGVCCVGSACSAL